MKIIVGLGNPGGKFKLNRHNIGFILAEEIAKKYSQSIWISKFNGSYCKCLFEDQKFLILKPETFMNNSGKSIKAITSFFKTKASDLIIIHDDLDINLGRIKIKFSGGHAGHNGLKSIHEVIGDQYTRIRIGIGRPNDRAQVSSYVLSNFSISEYNQLDYYKSSILSGIKELINDDFSSFLCIVNSLARQFE